MRYDLSSIPVGATIHTASLRMTRYDLGGATGTGFKLAKIINNPGWIEGRGDAGGA